MRVIFLLGLIFFSGGSWAIELRPCSSHQGQGNDWLQRCVRMNFLAIEAEFPPESLTLRACRASELMTPWFVKCVNQNFQSLSGQLETYLSSCTYRGTIRGWDQNFERCLNTHFEEIAQILAGD